MSWGQCDDPIPFRRNTLYSVGKWLFLSWGQFTQFSQNGSWPMLPSWAVTSLFSAVQPQVVTNGSFPIRQTHPPSPLQTILFPYEADSNHNRIRLVELVSVLNAAHSSQCRPSARKKAGIARFVFRFVPSAIYSFFGGCCCRFCWLCSGFSLRRLFNSGFCHHFFQG